MPASAGAVAGDRVHVRTDRLDLVFSLDGANPWTWRACHPSCAHADVASGTAARFGGEDDSPPTRLRIRGPGEIVDLERLRFTAHLSEDARARVATFRTSLADHGVQIEKAFAVSRDDYEVAMTVRVLGPNASAFMAGRRLELELRVGRDLLPPPTAGFAAMLDRVSRVVVADGVVRAVDDGIREPTSLRGGDWVGFHSRFWALVVRPDGVSAFEPRPGASGAVSDRETDRLAWRYTFYSGPMESRALAHTDPTLREMLFAGLWSWLRALSFGLLFLLRALTAVVGHPGLAIIGLALSVKVVLLPLSAVAERLQAQVNATQVRLQPGIDAIKASHRGEERARRTLALYREHGVHPLYPLKSLLGVLIQLPVFIAVFDMLAEDFDLHRVAFLWIRDLSRPDELLRLPLCLPFFGCHLNLLPLLMSGISLATLRRFHSAVLTPVLLRRQRRNLMGLTLLFFLLFYTFPASMVLYWTSTNAFQLIRQEVERLSRRLGGRTQR